MIITLQKDSVATKYFAKVLREQAANPKSFKLLRDLVESDDTRVDDNRVTWTREELRDAL